MTKPPVKPFGDYHAERILMQTMAHTLRPKSGDRALVIAEVLAYLRDNLSFKTPDGRVILVDHIDKVLKGLSNVSEFAGGHHD
jgi:hypothetical protein